nr:MULTISPECIES: hypothetical protein [unclassified Clostridium]
MSNRAPSMNTVHPSVDPRGGIYPAEIDRLKNKIKLGDKISVNTEKGYVNINQDSTKPGIAHRRGTVIAKHKNLVVLEYPGGLTEAFRWAEIADKAAI